MISRQGMLAAVIGACFPTTILYADGFWNLQLAGMIGVVCALAGLFLSRHSQTWKQASPKLSTLFVCFLVGVPQFGIHADLPISSDLRVAIWMLIVGTGVAIWGLGVEMASKIPHERDAPAPISTD